MQTTLTIQSKSIQRSSLYGSFSARFVAFLVDTLLLLFIYTFAFYIITNDEKQLSTWKELMHNDVIDFSESLGICKLLFFNFYFPILHLLYFTILESSPKQATIGKFTLGLKVTDLRGKRINIAHAALRYCLKLASLIPLGLGFFLILSTRRQQTLHDFLARTLVVTE